MAEFRDPNPQELALISIYNSVGHSVVGIAGKYYVIKGEWEPPVPTAPRIRLRGIELDQRFHSIMGHAVSNPGETVTRLQDALQDFQVVRREFSPDHSWQLFG